MKAAALAVALLAATPTWANAVHVLQVNGEAESFGSPVGIVTVTEPVTVGDDDQIAMAFEPTWGFEENGAYLEITLNYAGYDAQGHLVEDYGTKQFVVTAPQTIGPNPECGDVECAQIQYCFQTSCSRTALCTHNGHTYCLYYSSYCNPHVSGGSSSCACELGNIDPECPDNGETDIMFAFPRCLLTSTNIVTCRYSVGIVELGGN